MVKEAQVLEGLVNRVFILRRFKWRSVNSKSRLPTENDMQISSSPGVGNLRLVSQMWLFWWQHLARLIFS